MLIPYDSYPYTRIYRYHLEQCAWVEPNLSKEEDNSEMSTFKYQVALIIVLILINIGIAATVMVKPNPSEAKLCAAKSSEQAQLVCADKLPIELVEAQTGVETAVVTHQPTSISKTIPQTHTQDNPLALTLPMPNNNEHLMIEPLK